MKIKKNCLYCGQANDSINYTCSCKQDSWFDQYRVLNIELELEKDDREKLVQTFHDYAFDNPQGMLQYFGIPFRSYLPQSIETVGNTPFHHLINLSNHFGSKVYIKNEGNNPSGCFKDRETMVCLLNSLRRNINRAVIYSSGNAAASAAVFSQKLNFQLITCVAGDTYPEKIEFIREHGSDVIVIGDINTNFEKGYRLFANINARGYFAKNGFDNWSVRNPYRVNGDKTTSLEIIKQLSRNEDEFLVPDYVVIPTANGSCLAGMWKGFKELKRIGITNKLPKMVSAGIHKASPIYEMVKRDQTDRPFRCDISEVDEEDARIGSIILAEEGYDSIEATKAIHESRGLAVQMHRSDMQDVLELFLDKEKELALRYAILPEPASLISLAAIKKIRSLENIDRNTRIVSVLTGHGLKAKEKIERLIGLHKERMELVEQILEHKQEGMVDGASKRGKILHVPVEYDKIQQAFEQLKSSDENGI